jgi:hypothetical protein
MSREPGQTLRVAMTAYRNRMQDEAAARRLTTAIARSLDGDTGEAGLGDALMMLRHLGFDLRRLSPAGRRMIADAEKVCRHCPVAAACGAVIGGDPAEPAAAPSFCPNVALFRQLLRHRLEPRARAA